MKAVGFFAAIFLSMLAFFVVATGEFELWLEDDSQGGPSSSASGGSQSADASDDKNRNMLDFDFWNVKLGRRNFTIRAELPSGDLRDGSRLDQLETLQLRDGVIEIPLYDAKDIGPRDGEAGGADAAAREEGQLRLTFDRAVYRRSGGLVRGSGDVSVVLFDGKGATHDGTEFYFEELLFSNVDRNPGVEADADDKSRFSFRSDKNVRIVNPYLEVHSSKGLRGEIGQRGIEQVHFLPPVATYLDPSVIGDFALGEKSSTEPRGGAAKGEAGEEAELSRRVVITCAGGLLLDFQGARDETGSARTSETERPSSTHIRFTDGVVVYNAAIPRGTVSPPKPRGNRFECETLTLEIDDEGRRPVPRRAVARSEGGRVRTLIVRGSRTFTLEGDQLEWKHLGEDPATDTKVDGTDGIRLSEGYLTGSPTLVGPEVDFSAERAVLRPHRNSVVLEKVIGVFKPTERREGRERETAARVEGVVRSKLDAGRSRTSPHKGLEGTAGSGKAPDLAQIVDFSADEVELIFDEDPESGRKGLSRFVARGEGPKAVKIRGRGSNGDAETGAKPFDIVGAELTYDAIKKQVTLVGEQGTAPRLTQGSSWIEASAVHLLVDGGPQAAWFEGDVSARLDDRDFRREETDEANDGGAAAKGDARPRVFEIRCQYLGLAFDESRELTSALARGDADSVVTLRTLEGPAYRFVAQEARLLSQEKVVELFSAKDADSVDRLARMELAGGVIRAAHVHFAEPTRTVELDGQVELRLYEGDEITPKPTVLVRGSEAQFVLRRGEGVGTESRGDHPLAKLSLVETLKARGDDERPLVVEGENFELRGEVVDWSAESEKLVFSGSGLQEILVRNGQLSGPVRARTVTFDAARGVVLLETSVAGKLQQLPRNEDGSGGLVPRAPKGARSRRPLVWEFETSSLELELAGSAETTEKTRASAIAVSKVTARDKVLLYTPDQAVLLRGDDLIYDAVRERVDVFSRDGRRQTLQHFTHPTAVGRSLAQVTEAGATDPEGPVDTIHAQRIVVHLVEHSTLRTDEGRARQMLVVQFRKDVIANFYVTDTDDSAAARPAVSADQEGAGKHWQMIAQRLTLHVDPQQGVSQEAVLPWALAVGTVEGPQGNVTINSGPYQAFAERVEYRAAVKELVLSGSSMNPATIVERRARPNGPMLREQHQVIILRKEGDTVAMESARRVTSREPWPGAPDFGDE